MVTKNQKTLNLESVTLEPRNLDWLHFLPLKEIQQRVEIIFPFPRKKISKVAVSALGQRMHTGEFSGWS